jgi:DNA-binding response OmpR family regulator
MHVLVASSSHYRSERYRADIERLGHQVSLVGDGIECLRFLRSESCDLMILETPLLWGGSDGVLDVMQAMPQSAPPVILVAVGSGAIDWFQLGRFRLDDFLFRLPTAQELDRAISDVCARRSTAWTSEGMTTRS